METVQSLSLRKVYQGLNQASTHVVAIDAIHIFYIHECTVLLDSGPLNLKVNLFPHVTLQCHIA